MDVVNVPEILARINKHCDNPSGAYGCIMWKGGTYDGLYGKMRNPLAKLPGQPTYMRVHRLVYLLHHIKDFKTLTLDHIDENGQNIEVSHLCHKSLCVNIAHLSLEMHQTNLSRRACVAEGECRTHGDVPACLLWYVVSCLGGLGVGVGSGRVGLGA